MKINLKRIFAVISLLVLATICLQVYWNYKNYLSNKIRLHNEVQIAYDFALEKYFDEASKETFISVFSKDSSVEMKDFIAKIKADSIFGKKMKNEKESRNLSKNNIASIYIDFKDVNDDEKKLKSKKSIISDTTVISKKNIKDSLNKSISNFRLGAVKIEKDSSRKENNKINFTTAKPIDTLDLTSLSEKPKIIVLKGKKALDSIGGEQFPNKITMSFVNDTIKYKVLDSIFNKELNRKNIILNYQFQHFKKDTLFDTYIRSNEELPFQIKPNSTYLKPKESINLNYNYSNGLIVKRMGVELILSLLFSLAVIGCLYFLLFIIKTQKKVDEIKNDFINNITHEFKTPITTIATALEGMSTFNPENNLEKNKKYIDMSFNQLFKLENMVEKILETATLNAKELQLNLENINLIVFIKSIIKKHQNISKKQITYKFEKEELYISADSFYLENAISNLIDNAIKYGGNNIEINCFQTDKTTIIKVKDNGNSILKSQEKLIFEKFYRIPKGNIHDIKGSGIGLYFTKTIVEKHFGTIELIITNETIFKITLPND
jgi:two-component system phosphate regulon sensor histidine kinase PhoR